MCAALGTLQQLSAEASGRIQSAEREQEEAPVEPSWVTPVRAGLEHFWNLRLGHMMRQWHQAAHAGELREAGGPRPEAGGSPPVVVTCPEGVSAGEVLIVTAPDGRELEIVVPAGVQPGDEFELVVPDE